MTKNLTIGGLIRERRIAQALSLGQLASRLGVPPASVRSWERGEETLPEKLAPSIADALGLKASDLIEATPSPTAAVPTKPKPPKATVEPKVEAKPKPAKAKAVDEPDVAAPEVAEPDAVEPKPAQAKAVAKPDVAAPDAVEPDAVEPKLAKAKAATEPEAAEPEVVEPEAELVEEAASLDENAKASASEASAVDRETKAPQVEIKADLAEPVAGPEAGAESDSPDPEVVNESSAATSEGEASEAALTDLPTQVVEAIPVPFTDEVTQAVPQIPVRPSVDDLASTAAVDALLSGGATATATSSSQVVGAPVTVVAEKMPYWKDPNQRWRYWARAIATVAIMGVFLVVLGWAFGELSDALGGFLDQFSDASDADPLNR